MSIATLSADIDLSSRIASDPLGWARRSLTTGRKVIGLMPMYVPEEIVHAAGMVPLALPGRRGPTLLGGAHLHGNMCHPVRADFESALAGELAFLDGIVFADICDQTKRVGNLWEIYHHPTYTFHLRLPKRLDTPLAGDFYRAELARFRSSLELFGGRSITDVNLRASIAAYNRFRRVIARLYEMRRRNPEIFAASELASIMTSSMVMPKEDLADRLTMYANARESNPRPVRAKPKVVVCGNPCEAVEPALLTMIAESGATIVDDCLYSGSMYLSPLVREEGDPIEALAEVYLASAPCPTKFGLTTSWADHIIGLAKVSGADGLVVILHKYCEVFSFDYQHLQKRLSEEGIPHALLEIEHGGANERARTVLQALVEMLRGSDEPD